MVNKGLENEMQIISEIDRRRIKKMTVPIQNMLEKIFGHINQFKMLRADKCDTYDKADIYVSLDNETHYISIKCGTARTIHSCYIKPFILFLRRYNISVKTQKTLLLYHYGDGTMDGTGTTRLDYNSVMVQMRKEIRAANCELNSNKQLVYDFAEMCLFFGLHPEAQDAEYIYHGTTEHGFCASKHEIRKFIQSRSFSYINNIHIGPILIRPYARYTDFKDTNPNKRHMIQCDWPNLAKDIEYIDRGFK